MNNIPNCHIRKKCSARNDRIIFRIYNFSGKSVGTRQFARREELEDKININLIGKEVNHQSQLYVCVLYCYT
jgi:hypothetical protein